MAVVSVVLSTGNAVRWTDPGIVYVGGGTAIWRDGFTPERAFETIQQALDQALPGDTILIGEGIFHERLHVRRSGTLHRPIKLVAKTPGTVKLTWEMPLSEALNSGWRNEGDGIISATTRWPVYRIHLNDSALFREVYGGPNNLRRLVLRSGAANAFCWEDGRLFVWLRPEDQRDRDQLVSHRRAPTPREWGEFRAANISVAASHIRISGLQCNMGVGAGLRIVTGDDIQISDCAFSGATYGILSENTSSRNIMVDRCLYHHYPQYNWRQSWLNWDEIYVGHASSCLVSSSSDAISIERSVGVHVGDGIRASNRGNGIGPDVIVRKNMVAFATDDAFEIEGPACNVLAESNLVYECHESLGLSPVEQGPVTIRKNCFLHEKDGTNGAQVKLINRDGVDQEIRNIRIEENIFVGNWLCWMKGDVENVVVTNNLFCVANIANPTWPYGLEDIGNTYLTRAKNNPNEESFRAEFRELKRSNEIRWQTIVSELPTLSQSGPEWWDWNHPATVSFKEKLDETRFRLGTP